MAYTATKTLQPRGFFFPYGFDNTFKTIVVRGQLMEDNNAGNYSIGGVGSTAFQVTAFSSVGLVTFNQMLGIPLYNGQRVVIYNTGSNTNDGTYTVSQLTMSSTTAGTFVAVPIPGKTLAGSSQTTQTAEGVGQLVFNVRQLLAQTFTVTSVAFSSGVTTYTYTTLVGPELCVGDKVTIAGMTNAANNGTFSMTAVYPTSSTAGSFTVNNPSGVGTDSGTGTGLFTAGELVINTNTPPIQVTIFSQKGYDYVYDEDRPLAGLAANRTVRVFLTGTSANTAFNEAGLGATVAYDGTLTFEAIFERAQPN